MGAVFALASATADITTAQPEAVATGMRITVAVAATLILVGLTIVVGTYRRILRNRFRPDLHGSTPQAEAIAQ